MPCRFRAAALLLTLCPVLLLTACFPLHNTIPLPFRDPQTYQQLHLPSQNSEPLVAVWIPFFTVDTLLSPSDDAACREGITAYLQSLRDLGINTVFLHVCAFGESYYPSVYYPMAEAANGRDAMALFTDACQILGLSLHAWINPLRLQTTENMELQTDDAALCNWYHDDRLRAAHMLKWEGRWYLNPAAASTGKFLTGAVSELMAAYQPAGIHIDDYFYPTAAADWDAIDFADSGAQNLADWRRSNITDLMRTLYAAVHHTDAAAVFSVSPQGNFTENYDVLYADTAEWASAGDCCDWLIPQLYFGYENEHLPFTETLQIWGNLSCAENVRLAAGLAVYKVGQSDEFAGSGAEEWRSSGIPARQTADILLQQKFLGVSFYHADALLALSDAETAALMAVLKGR